MPRKNAETENQTVAAVTSDEHLTGDEIVALLQRGVDEAKLKDREAEAITRLSRQLKGQSNKDAAAEMGKTLWKLYDIRVAAMRKLMPLVGVEDIEEMYSLLDIKRGKKAPERHTQYFPKKNPAPVVEEPENESDDEDFEDDEPFDLESEQ